MSPSSIIHRILNAMTSRKQKRRSKRRDVRLSSQLAVEALEDRVLLSTFTVTNTKDSGDGSLRAAVALANANPDADMIVFDEQLAGKTIKLTSDTTDPAVAKYNSKAKENQVVYGRTALAITSNVTIDGESAPGLKLSGDDKRRLFVVAGPNALTPVSGAKLTLKNLTISDGRAQGGRGFDDGVNSESGGGGGGAGLGGAVFVDGSTLMTDQVIFSNNAAFGGLTYYGKFAQAGGGLSSLTTVRNSGGILARFGAGGYGGGYGGGGGSGGFGGGGGGSHLGGHSSGGFGGGKGGSGGAGTSYVGNGAGTSYVVSGGGGAGMGGAIFNYAGTITLENSTFSSNTAHGGGSNEIGKADRGSGLGGAIFNLGGTAKITGSTCSDNSAKEGGGAIYNAGAIDDSDIANSVKVGPADIKITNCIFNGNKSHFGAAVFNGGTGDSPDSTLQGNQAGIQGGAYYNAAGAVLVITGDQMRDNSAGQNGGGIANFGTLTISGATLDRNDAGLDGGGIANATGAILNVTNDVFDENNADRNGGAIFDEGTELITTTTMTDNTAGNAGGGFFELGGQQETTTNDFTEAGDEVTGTSSFTVLGAGIGSSPLVQLRDNATGDITLSFLAYDSSFKGGVQATQGWVADADGVTVEAIITAPVSGNTGEIRIFDAQTGDLIRSIAAFPTGGASVAVGDLNGDGLDEIVVGAGPNSAPVVKVYAGDTGDLLQQFNAFGTSFKGGVNVAVGDINGDGVSEIIVGSRTGALQDIGVFNGQTGAKLRHFSTFNPSVTGGVNLAVGDVDGDGIDDIIVGSRSGQLQKVAIYNGQTGTKKKDFSTFASNFTGGVNVAVGDVNGDGIKDILVSAGPGGQSEVKVFDGTELTLLDDYFANPGKKGYAYVG